VIVCICRRVNERAVAAAIAEGHTTPAQLGQACGAGTECGGCQPALKRLCEAAGSTCTEGTSERNVRT
jgi:bacterioferritin-associated ferredoxin